MIRVDFDPKNEEHIRELERVFSETDAAEFLSGCERLFVRYILPAGVADNLVTIGLNHSDVRAWGVAGLFLEAYAHDSRVFQSVASKVGKLPNPFSIVEYMRNRPERMLNQHAVGLLRDMLNGHQRSEREITRAKLEAQIGERGVVRVIAPRAIVKVDLERLAQTLPAQTIRVATPHRRVQSNVAAISDHTVRNRFDIGSIEKFSNSKVFDEANGIAVSIAELFKAPEGEDGLQEAVRIIIRDRIIEGLLLLQLVEEPEADNEAPLPVAFWDKNFARLYAKCFNLDVMCVSQFGVEMVQPQDFDEDGFSRLCFEPGKIAGYSPTMSQSGLKGAFVVHGGVRDRNVWLNLRPLLQEITQHMPVLLEPDGIGEDVYLKDFSQFEQMPNLKAVCAKEADAQSHPHLLPIREEFDAAWRAYCEGQLEVLQEDTSAGKNLFVALSVAPTIRRLVTHFAEIYRHWDEGIATSRGVLVMHGRRPAAMALVALAKKYNKPTFELQPAFISTSGNYVTPQVDTVFAYDRRSAATYQKLGVDEKKVVEVGSPRIGAYLSTVSDVPVDEARRQAFGVNSKSKNRYVIFAGQPVPDEYAYKVFEETARGLSALDENWHLVLRVHPREDAERIRNYIKIATNAGLPRSRLISGVGDAMELKAADAVITYYSLVGLEAVALEIPVISVRPGKDIEPPFDLCDIGAMGQAFSAKEVSDLLLKAVSKKNKRDALQVSQEKSSEKICEIILKSVGDVRV